MTRTFTLNFVTRETLTYRLISKMVGRRGVQPYKQGSDQQTPQFHKLKLRSDSYTDRV